MPALEQELHRNPAAERGPPAAPCPDPDCPRTHCSGGPAVPRQAPTACRLWRCSVCSPTSA
eukprot:2820398-Lingulodinium_polyedra.AAC.1